MVQRLRTIKMKRLTAIICVVILLMLKLKGFDCADNTTTPPPVLILPPSRYPSSASSDDSSFGGMTPSELALISSSVLVPPESVHTIVLLINALPTSPYLLSCLPPQTVCCILAELARRPSLLNAIAPPNVVCLLDTLCASPSLMKVAPDRTVCDLIAAVVLSPKIVDALRPSTVVCLLSKVSPTALSLLSPAVRASLVHCALSPKAFGTLTPSEISIVLDVLVSADRALAESSAPADIIQLLNTTVLSSSFTNNMSATRAVDLLCLLSKTALVGNVPQNVVDALLASLASSAHRLPAATLARLMAVLTCSPFELSSMDPATVALLLAAWSPSGVLSTIPRDVLVRLLIELSNAATVSMDVIIGLLYGCACASPRLMCDLPPCVRSAYVIRLTSLEVTDTLSIETSVKFIGVLCKNQCFITELTANFMKMTMAFMVSNSTLLNALPPPDIVDFLHAVITGTGCVLREIPPEIIQKLMSFMDLVSSLRALDTVHLSKLLSCIGRSSYLISALSGTQLVNLLETLTSVSGQLQGSSSFYVNIVTQLMTMPSILSEIPFATFLDLLKQIESQTSGSVLCALPPCVINNFNELLGANNGSTIASLPPADLTALAGFLINDRCFLAELSVDTLIALFESISASSFVVPLEVKINLIIAIYRLSPSVLCSLPPESIGNICKSFGSFDVLQSGLNTTCMDELLTTIFTCPCLMSAFDYTMIQDILEYLSTSRGVLSRFEPGAVANLVISISFDEPLRTFLPVGSIVRFLLAANTVRSCPIPTTAAVVLLKSLTSMDLMVGGLTSIEAADLATLLAEDHLLLCALPPAVLINLLTGMTNQFAELPRECIVHLLAATHLASPSLLCAVPRAVLAGLLELICTRSAVGCLPSEYLAVLVAVLSTSRCLLDAIPATALESLMGLLLSQPALTAEVVPPHTLANLCTILALTPSALDLIDVSIIISLLSAFCPKSVCAIPTMALSTLLEPLSNAKIVYELRLTVIARLLRLATTSPCILDVLAGPTLNTIVVKAASSPHLIQHLPPDILQCFIAAVACSRPALESLRPTTIAHLLTSIAEVRPCVLSTLSSATATAILGAFGSQHAFASLPPPALDGLIDVLVKFPNLFASLPLSVLNDMLQFFVSTPAVLGSMLSCTLLKFLSVLASMPPLLNALPPCTLAALIDSLCTVSPTFLCAFPVPIVTALFNAVAAGPALTALTPPTVASLVSALNASPCLISVLPAPLLSAFLAYLANNPCLLSNTPRPALLAFANNVQCPRSIPPVVLPVGCGLPCVAISRFGDVSANGTSSSRAGDLQILPAGNSTNPIIIHPANANGTSTVWCFPKKQ